MEFKLDNHFLSLKADPLTRNQPRAVLQAHYSFVTPRVFEAAQIVHYSEDTAALLGFSNEAIKSEVLQHLLKGQNTLGTTAYAACYGGHQFGHWAGQLGDGRAITFGQIKGKDQTYTLQFKGLGPTPYSRAGDGYAVLRSSIREYLMSEAMAYLGVPTTRALSLALSGELVTRDRLYNGNPQKEPGAIVCRIAPHFIRFGSFEIFAAREDIEHLKLLVDYTIEQYYPDLSIETNADYLLFFKAVMQKSLQTLIHWQSIGFVHGVLNTDNMSISGETIDYGPYGFLDEFDPTWTPNTTDAEHRRYCYENQPNTVLWNLYKVANALYSLVEYAKGFESILNRFKLEYELEFLKHMKLKLGCYGEHSSDEATIDELIELLRMSKADYSLFFRRLSELNANQLNLDQFRAVFYIQELDENLQHKWKIWFKNLEQRWGEQIQTDSERQVQMKTINPRFILRNYMLEEVIQAAESGDYQLLNEFAELIKTPYEDNPKASPWIKKKPDTVGDSALSCSS